MNRSLGFAQYKTGLLGEGELSDYGRYGVSIERFERQIGGKSGHPYVVGVEQAVGPLGAADIVADGTVPDEY